MGNANGKKAWAKLEDEGEKELVKDERRQV